MPLLRHLLLKHVTLSWNFVLFTIAATLNDVHLFPGFLGGLAPDAILCIILLCLFSVSLSCRRFLSDRPDLILLWIFLISNGQRCALYHIVLSHFDPSTFNRKVETHTCALALFAPLILFHLVAIWSIR